MPRTAFFTSCTLVISVTSMVFNVKIYVKIKFYHFSHTAITSNMESNALCSCCHKF